MLSIEARAFNLQCEFKDGDASRWGYANGGRECYAKNMVVTSIDQVVTSVNGHSFDFFQNENIKTFHADTQTVHYIPKGIAKFFPQIEELRIHKSKLKSVKRADLEPFKNLISLLLDGNELEELDSDLLQSHRNIRGLHFVPNKIKFVGERFFDNLDKLERIYFQDNICVNRGSNTVTLQAVKTEILLNCVNYKEKYCKSDIAVLNSQIIEMKIETEEMKLQIKTLKEEKLKQNEKIVFLESKIRSMFAEVFTEISFN